MIRLILAIEGLFYKFREFMWNYPDLVFGKYSISSFLSRIYSNFLPFSHIISSILLIGFITVFSFTSPLKSILASNSTTLIEGVVVGADQNGNLNRVTSINPLLASNLQVQRDLVELIYEPLLKINYADQKVGIRDFEQNLILAKEIVEIRTGAEYIIVLKDNVVWHDGAEFSANDVTSTFDLVSQLQNDTTSVQALRQMIWEPIGLSGVRICTKATETSTSCNETTTAIEPLFFSNFLELISIKILPAHLIQDINSSNYDSSLPELFRAPVGTGPFKFQGVNAEGISLSFNYNYHSIQNEPAVKNIRFKYFRSLEIALNSLLSGEIHSVATASTEFKRRMSTFPQVNVFASRPLYNQYWAIYFNQRTNPEGGTIGSFAVQDARVRKAISLAINRDEMLAVAMESIGQKATGPIPEISIFNNQSVNFSTHSIEESARLLDESGWGWVEGSEYRYNSAGEKLSFKLYFVESFDRKNLANYLQLALKRVGVEVQIPENINSPTGRWSLEDINNQFLTTGLFDALIYGVSTFVDPDRYELFHSSQSRYPGLNLAGYIPSEITKIIGDVGGRRDIIDYPKIDRILEEARSLNPVGLFEERRIRYNEFQELLYNDMPVVFLFHPQFIYYTSRRLSNVDTSSAWAVEERFGSFWTFQINN